MDKILTEMFSRQPDEVIYGDYIYHLPYYEKWSAEIKEAMRGKEWHEQQEINMKNHFKYNWLRGDANPFLCHPLFNETTFEETIHTIARNGKPFMDIASSESMGLAPGILKMNPEIPCLVTDIDADTMKQLRLCINENLFGYNINIASFDNLDIPIKDETLDYITSMYGITSSGKIPTNNQRPNIYQYSIEKEKPINEIYRILKPGGQFITIEMNRECDYDLQTIYNEYNKHGKKYGLYTYDEMQAVCELLIEEPWQDKFTSAGFQIEVKKIIYKRYSLHTIMNFLYHFTDYHGIHRWEKRKWNEEISIRDIKDCDTENTGFDLYETDTFFVLKKPEKSLKS